jgi:hypothetical protein
VVELRQLEYFLAVVEERSFTRGGGAPASGGIVPAGCRTGVGSSQRGEVAVAEHELLDLPRGGLGELLDDLPDPGNLVLGEVLTAEGRQVVGIRCVPRGGSDEGGHLLAHLGVGDADDGDIGDMGVGQQQVLDLAGVDVLPATMIMSFSRPCTRT